MAAAEEDGKVIASHSTDLLHFPKTNGWVRLFVAK